jgi:hypothetical protein
MLPDVGRTTALLGKGIALLFFAVACSPDPEGKTLGDPTGSVCAPASTLTWGTFGQVFIQEHCARCHDEERPRIVTQADVQANLELIDRAAAAGPEGVNTYMPEDRGVPESERRALGEWLACGAP